MNSTELKVIDCPYCGEQIEIVVDASEMFQAYIEDCQVCCRPITMQVAVEGMDISVRALHENEY